MRRTFIRLNVLAKAAFRHFLLILILLIGGLIAGAQPIAIKANGKIMNAGDTITICVGGTVIHEIIAQNYSSIVWQFENGNPNTGISGFQPVTYAAPGVSTSKVSVTYPGRIDSSFIYVNVSNILPVANFNFAPNNQCVNDPVIFTNSSTGTGLKYTWNFGDGGPESNQANPTYQFYNSVGPQGTFSTYNVSLDVTNEYQCKASITKVVTIKNGPDASISSFQDLPVTFGPHNGIPTFKKCDISNGTVHNFKFQTASSTPGNISSYSIDWGDGSPVSTFPYVAPGNMFSHNYSIGQYVLTVTALSSSGGCEGVKKYNVFFGTTPAGGLISSGNYSICAPNVLTFPVSGTSPNASSTTYTFNVNDGSGPISYTHQNLPTSISHLFTAGSCGNFSSNGTLNFSNSYKVTLDIENACGTTSNSVIPIYVSGKPRAAIQASPVVCVGIPTTIVNSSQMGGTVTPTGGVNSICTINSKVVWTITPGTGFTLAPGSSLGDFGGTPTNYLNWNTGSASLNITFTQTGTYTIKINVGNECGYSESIRTICVRNAPSASFTMDKRSGCGPMTTIFSNTSPVTTECSGESYSWEINHLDPSSCAGSGNYSFLNGTSSTSRNPQINFTNPGLYVVKLNVFANGSSGCLATFTDTVKVLEKPSVIINPIGTVCVGVPVSPTAQVNNCYSNAPLNLLWNFSPGTPGSSTQLVPGNIDFPALGSYPISLQATNECGTTPANATVIISSSPTANAGPDKTICSGETTQIGTTPATGITYSWSPATGLSDPNIANPTFNLTYNGPNDQETFTYTLTASAGPTCVVTDQVQVTVKKKPTLVTSPDPSPVCAGTPVILTVSGAASYAWSPATGLSATTGNSVTATPNATTTYTVTGTGANGCVSSSTITVAILASPAIAISNDTTVCSFSPAVQLSAQPSGGTWSGSSHLSSTGLFDVPAAGNGVYNLTYTVVTGNCTRTAVVKVTVINTPVVNAGNDSTFCQDNLAVQLTPSPAGGRWSGSPFVTQNGLFNTSVPGTYTLTYTYGSGLCIGSDEVVHTVVAGIGNNAIGLSQSICAGSVPATLVGQNVTGGNGTPQYQWQSSTNNFTWVNIPGATGKDYSPGALSVTTYFRRIASTTTCLGLQANYSSSVKITINPNAKAEFSPLITSGCPPFAINSSIINATPHPTLNSSYQWYVNGVFVGAGIDFPGHTIVNNNESATIMLIAVSAFGCKDDTLSQVFTAAGTPPVNAGADTTICAGSAPFQLLGSPAGGRWSGSQYVSFNGVFNPFTPGTYMLTYTFGSGACLGSDTKVVTVSAGLANNIISSSQTICSGSIPTTLTGFAVTGGNGAADYQWQSSTNNITWNNIPGATGKDYAPGALTQTTWFRRIANSNLCAGNTSDAVKIMVNPNAVASFSPNLTSGCPPFVITPSIINLIPSATVSDYQWFVNGTFLGSGLLFPGYTIQNNNQSVTIMLVAISAFGCKNDSIQHVFTAAGTPSVSAGNDTTICAGGMPIQLTGSPAGGRWTGSPLVALNGLFNPSNAGTYTLVYTYGSGACIGTDAVEVTVSAGLSNNNISSNQTICTGAISATLNGLVVTGGNGAPDYQWQSSTNNITWNNIAGATGKDYAPGSLTQTTWFRRIANSNLCAGNTSDAVKITVNPNAVASFSPNLTSGCPPFEITPSIINLIPSATVSDYHWFVNGNFLGSGLLFPGYTIQNNNESVTIKLVAISASGCKNDSIQHVFTAAGTPSVSAGNDTTICAGGMPIQLVGSPAGGRWTGSPLVALNGLFNPSNAGTYTLVYTYGSGACIGTDAVVVTVSAGLSNNIISANQTICTGAIPATLTGLVVTGGNGATDYQWQSSTNNIVWNDIPGATGKDYAPGALTQSTWFRRVANSTLCAGNTSAPVKITVNPNATALFNPSVTSGCPPFVITPSIINLTSFNTVSEYQWFVNGVYVGSGVDFPGLTLANNNDSATIMLVAVSAYGCKSDTLQHGFVAAGSPVVNAGTDVTLCNGGMPFQLTGSPAGGRWSGTPFVTVAGSFNPSTSGTYNLIYTFGSGACIGNDTVIVTVAPPITGNIIADAQTICLGTLPAPLTGQNISGGNGTAIYQWQFSTNNISWTDVAGATGVSYAPGALTQTTWFRRIANTSLCPGLQANTSNIIKITVTPDAEANFNPTVFNGCPPFSITPSIINLTPNSTTVSNYYWYANGNYLGSGDVFTGYTITNNNDSVQIMLVLISAFGCANDTTIHTFYASGSPVVNAGADTVVCAGGAPFQLTGSPIGGRWTGSAFVSVNGLFNPTTAGTYTLIYTFGSGACIARDTMEVTVTSGVTNNIITGEQQICIGTLATIITGQPIAGGAGSALYQWQKSTNNVNWTNIPGATQQDYDPGVLLETTWFRREATTTVCAGAQSNFSTAVKVTVNPNAKAQFDPMITASCAPFVITPSIINLTPFGAGNLEYKWFANGIQIGTGQTFPGYTIVNNQDSVTIRLVTISRFGCKNDTTEHKFYSSGTPVVNAGPDTTICHLSFPIQLPGNPAGGRWSGNFVTVGGVFTPSTVGTHQLVYTYGSGTCLGRDTVLVTVSEGITNNIIGGNQTICINTAATIIVGQLINGGTTAPEYQWQSSTDGITWNNINGATGKDYNPGTLSQNMWYRRVATTSICNGLQSSISAPSKVIINADAKAIFNPTITAGCVPFNINPSIINLTPDNTNIVEYKWFVNGNYLGSGQSFPGYTMTNSNDSIKIKLVAISRFGCLNDSVEHKFTSADAPAPSFTQSDSINCGPLTITFTNTTPNAARYNYFWNFGNGQTSNQVQPGAINYPVATLGGDTVYTVRMSAFTACDTTTVVRQVVVRSKPRVHFLPNRSEGCSPFTVTFTNLSSGRNANYVWDFGDGTPPVASNANTIQHTYTAGVRTTFQVKLVGTNDCGVDSFINPIIVTPNAILVNLSVIGGDSVGCAPHIVRFVNNTSGASNFRWDFGDGDLLTTNNPRDTIYHTYSATGIYNIVLKAIGNCNDTTVRISVNVKVKPVIRFTATPMVACLGDTIRFTNLSDAGTESFWRFGDGTTSYARNPVKVYNVPGTYRVKLYGTWNNVTSSSCNDSALVDLIIRDTMPGSFRVSDSVSSCIPFTVSFVNESGPSSNTVWNFGNGFTASGDSVVHTFNTVGTYNVVMATRNIGGCTFTHSKIIKVNAPTGTLMYNGGYACVNENVRFEVRNGNAAQYLFVFGDGDSLTSSSTIIFHKYTMPGRYIPHAYLLDGNCRIRIDRGDTIKVDKIAAGFRSSFIRTCGITTFQFTDTSKAYYGVSGWQWDFGDGTVSPSKNPAKQYTSDGTYYVQLMVNGISGCLDTVRVPINVSIRRAPVGDIGSDTIACTGVRMNFAALIQSQDSVVNVAWNFGNNTAGIGTNVFAVYNVPGVYQVRLVTTTMYGCADTALKTIRVDATPMVNAGADKQICRGESTQMSVFGASTYTWSPIQSLSCATCPNPVASPLMSTQYVVTGKTQLGCTNTDTILVNVVQPFKVTVSPADTICIGETTQMFATGAARYLWNPVSGLSSGTVANPIASPTSTTDYMVIGRDNYNCFADTGYIRLVVGPYPTVKLNNGGTVLVGSMLTLNASITNGPISRYTWTPADDLSCTNCPRPIAVINKPITYKLEVENIYGCTATDTVSYKVRCEEGLQVYIPNAFSPDGDGLNDVFMVRGKGLSAVKYFRVFNRWGQMIFERSNFSANDPRNGWDGKVNGVPANPDVYVYTAEIACAAGDTFVRKGNVTLVR